MATEYELEWIWKEVVVASFEALYLHFPARIKETTISLRIISVMTEDRSRLHLLNTDHKS
jgi:hypothetical protein